jgi:hypothetical protein
MSSLPKPLGQPWRSFYILGTHCILRQYGCAAMKVNPAVALTLILLSLMLGAGITSAIWGYRLGRESLKGVTQPNTRPISSENAQGPSGRREELVFFNEDDILANVKAQIQGISPDGTPPQ